MSNSFPRDFLWGSSTSSFQAEGAASEDGKGVTVTDLRENDGSICNYEVASDHYHHYKEDVALMAELGLKAYRFSISWARIFPNGNGTANQLGIDFYNNLINELVAHNIEPVVTIYHFDYPQGLVEQYGGWLSRKSISDFESYAELLFSEYGDRVKYWLTINEQDHVVHMPYRLGIKNTNRIETEKLGFQANHHMCVATARVIELCRRMLPNALIGPAVSFNAVYPATSRPEDILAAQNHREIRGYYLLDLHCRGEYNPVFTKYLMERNQFPKVHDGDLELMRNNKPDFIAFNYYSSSTVEEFPVDDENPFGTIVIPKLPIAEAGEYRVVKNKNLSATDWGWEIDSIGLRIVMRELFDRYQLPLMITENGYGANEDDLDGFIEDNERINYLNEHLIQVREALSEGIPVIGYCNWSFIDLVSGHDGFRKRYGLVRVDRTDKEIKTMSRSKKKSFYWYKEVIQSNGNGLK